MYPHTAYRLTPTCSHTVGTQQSLVVHYPIAPYYHRLSGTSFVVLLSPWLGIFWKSVCRMRLRRTWDSYINLPVIFLPSTKKNSKHPYMQVTHSFKSNVKWLDRPSISRAKNKVNRGILSPPSPIATRPHTSKWTLTSLSGVPGYRQDKITRSKHHQEKKRK